MLADAGIPVVVHCGHGPLRGDHTGPDVFVEVLAAHPSLVAVLAMPGCRAVARGAGLGGGRRATRRRFPARVLHSTPIRPLGLG